MYRLPQMILFDYGQTLVDEGSFEPIRGNEALLNRAMNNPNHVTIDQIQELANALSEDIGQALSSEHRNGQALEITMASFNRYLYEYLELEFPEGYLEQGAEWEFWINSVTPRPADHIEELLELLHRKGIRTGVVSNMMRSGQSIKRMLDEQIPSHHFEFILSSADYMFRKPHKRFFDMALKKAGLPADQIWFCGDNLHCDVEGALRAGMNPVWYLGTEADILHAHKKREADWDPEMSSFVEVHDWKELIAMVEALTDPGSLLFDMVTKDCPKDGSVFRRTAVRGLIRRGETYAMIHSAKYGEYKFPGGGVEPAEQLTDTLTREVEEETGLLVKPGSIEYLGRVEERRKGLYDDILWMDSHYCFCKTEESGGSRCLDAYEAEYGYELEFVTLKAAIANNEQIINTDGVPWIVRDTEVMRWLLGHGF